MEIKNNIKNIKICNRCFGAGKLKVMQSAAYYNGESVREEDLEVECKFCEGAGVINNC